MTMQDWNPGDPIEAHRLNEMQHAELPPQQPVAPSTLPGGKFVIELTSDKGDGDYNAKWRTLDGSADHPNGRTWTSGTAHEINDISGIPTGTIVLGWVAPSDGDVYFEYASPPVIIEITDESTGTPGDYSATRLTLDASGNHANAETWTNGAHEVNGVTGIPSGTIVRGWLDPSDGDVYFEYQDPIVVIEITDESSGTAGDYSAKRLTIDGSDDHPSGKTWEIGEVHEVNDSAQIPNGTIVRGWIDPEDGDVYFQYYDGKVKLTSDDTEEYLWEKLEDADTAAYEMSSDLLVAVEQVDSEPNESVRFYVDISAISGYNEGKTQVLGHELGTLKWIDTDTCE